MRIPAYLLLAGLFASSNALAHGLWTEERRGNIEVVYGHGAEDDAFKAEKISGAWAYDAAGRMIPVTVERLSDHARLQPLKKPAVLGVALDNGAWSKTPEGQWINQGRSQVTNSTHLQVQPGDLQRGRQAARPRAAETGHRSASRSAQGRPRQAAAGARAGGRQADGRRRAGRRLSRRTASGQRGNRCRGPRPGNGAQRGTEHHQRLGLRTGGERPEYREPRPVHLADLPWPAAPRVIPLCAMKKAGDADAPPALFTVAWIKGLAGRPAGPGSAPGYRW